MEISRALRVTRNSRVALVGAGGKTTSLFQLARALEPPVVVANSTHLGTWQAELADRHLVVSRPEDVERFTGQLEGVTLLSGAPGEDNRLGGLDLETLAAVHSLGTRLNFPVLVEADGSRRKPLKAPGEHEPVIPDWMNLVVVVAGLSGLGQPLSEAVVYRPELFAKLSGMQPGEQINGECLARVLVDPGGGLKNIPPQARKAALLNQVDNDPLFEAALRVGTSIKPAYDTVLITSLSENRIWRVVEPTAGIILAGGQSSRLGQPKMLLDWRGKPLIRHVAETALAGGLDPLVVVTGAVEQPLRQALAGLPVSFTHNPVWAEGQSTSIRAGLLSLPENIGSAIFLLADQPLITPSLLQQLAEQHAVSLAPVVAPRVAGRRANPVLFDRDTFPRLLELQGDTGGRAILGQYPVEYVEWEDPHLLIDIDTPEDYERLKGMGV